MNSKLAYTTCRRKIGIPYISPFAPISLGKGVYMDSGAPGHVEFGAPEERGKNMKHKYVVGFISFFDNELKMEIVEANDESSALQSSSFVKGYAFPKNPTVEEIEQTMFDCDAAISVIKI